jgi:CheY-like chemotaxis protein
MKGILLNILVLDDNAHRLQFFQNGLKPHKVTVCHNAPSAIKALKTGTFEVIFLDHDLNGKKADPESDNCGSEVARYLAEIESNTAKIVLHTENSVGRESMEAILLESYSIPYGKLKKMGLAAVLKLLFEQPVVADQTETAQDKDPQ